MDNDNGSCVIYTDGSAIPNPGYAGYGFYGTCSNNKEHIGYGPVGTATTNNHAELEAVIQAIKYSIDLGFKQLKILPDSKYVTDNIKYLPAWERNNWVGSSGKGIANRKCWETLKSLLSIKSINVEFEWVRGHSGIIGNENADVYSNMGRKELEAGKMDHVRIVNENNTEVIDKIIKTDTDKVVKVKTVAVPKLHPLIFGNRQFFMTNTVSEVILDDGVIRKMILTTSFIKDKDNPNRNVAKHSADAVYGITLLDEENVALNSIRKLCDSNTNKNVPVLLDLTVLRKPKVWSDVVLHDNVFTKIKGSVISANSSDVIGDILQIPWLILNLESYFNIGMTLIRQYYSKEIRIIDITDAIYSVSGKKKVIVEDFKMGCILLTITKDNCTGLNSAIEENNGIPKHIKLNVGIDVPIRNVFSALLKDKAITDISVHALLWEILPGSYRVATVIETNNALGVYYNPDANLKFIEVKDDGK